MGSENIRYQFSVFESSSDKGTMMTVSGLSQIKCTKKSMVPPTEEVCENDTVSLNRKNENIVNKVLFREKIK